MQKLWTITHILLIKITPYVCTELGKQCLDTEPEGKKVVLVTNDAKTGGLGGM